MKSIIVTILILLSLSTFAQDQTKENMNSEKVTIEIWSDVVCPFCLLGKKKMEQAITKLGAEDRVEIVWHSFQLDPSFPKGSSMPSQRYLTERKGYPAAQLSAVSAQLANTGRAYGIDFQFDKALTFNTWDAHRLIQWAKSLDKGNELKGALMMAYFSTGADLSKQENLLAVVKQVGLDTAKARQILESDAYSQDVQQAIDESRQLGIRGVPFFVVNRKRAISGAQSDEVFEQIIGAAVNQLAPVVSGSQEGVCLPSGECKE